MAAIEHVRVVTAPALLVILLIAGCNDEGSVKAEGVQSAGEAAASSHNQLLTNGIADAKNKNTDPKMTDSAYHFPTCSEIEAEALDSAALSDQFDRTYPKTLVGVQSVETVALSQAELKNIVSYLVCVAGRTNYDIGVVESSLSLFASKRHGKAALGILDQIATGKSPEAANAGTFRQQVADFLAGPTG